MTRPTKTHTMIPSEAQGRHVLRLLAFLRMHAQVPSLDVTAAVMRRVRAMATPAVWKPLISLGQFAWACAAAVVVLIFGSLGTIGILGGAAGPGAGTLIRTARAFEAAGTGIARVILKLGLDLASRISAYAGPLDGVLGRSLQASAILVLTFLVVTIFVVSTETRAQRTHR